MHFAPKVYPRRRPGVMAKKVPEAEARGRRVWRRGAVGRFLHAPGAGGADPELDALRARVAVASGEQLRAIRWGVDLSDRFRLGPRGQQRMPVDTFRNACLRRVEHAQGVLDLASWGREQGDGSTSGGVDPAPATMAHYAWFNTRDDAEYGGELPATFVDGLLGTSGVGSPTVI